MFNDIVSLIAIVGIDPAWLKFPADYFGPSVIIVLLATLVALELNTVKNQQSKSVLLFSYRTNLLTFFFNDITLSVLSASSLLLLAEQLNRYGLLTGCDLPLKTAVSFIAFDLTLYLWHRANHRFDSLWRFHKVHHSDNTMNATTAFRIHFTELLLNTLLKALFIIVLGIEATVVAFCEAISTLFVIFHHANLTVKGEKLLSWLIVVPSLHRTHHSVQRSQHDSNYGAILSIWDRIFRTLSHAQPAEIGLNGIKAQNFFELLRFGLTPAGPVQPESQPLRHSQPQPWVSVSLNTMIAEAAYYKAEMRGFAPGWELLDWLDAEKEISAYVNQTI